METFSVMIKFPKDKSSSVVTVTGLEENVEDAKEHLLLLTEEYVSVHVVGVVTLVSEILLLFILPNHVL